MLLFWTFYLSKNPENNASWFPQKYYICVFNTENNNKF